MFDEPLDGLSIGVVGIGDMGFPIAQTILKAGYDVTAFDLKQEALDEFESLDGNTAASVRELATECRTVHLVVVNDEQARDAVYRDDGIFEGFRQASENKLLIVHSTLLPKTVQEFDQESPDDVTVIDAAVSGGVQRAEQGDLTVMVGGPDAAVDRYQSILETIAREVYHLGAVGNGLVAKLTNNAVSHAASAATMEALEVGKQYGIEPKMLAEIYSESSGTNYYVQNYNYQSGEKYRQHSAGPLGPVRNGKKNMYQYLSIARETGIEVPVGGLMSQEFPRLTRKYAQEYVNE